MKAFDMSKYQRVIGSEGRVSGKWCVSGGVGRNPDHLYVTPIDVTVFDETKSWGRVFYGGDFTLTVEDGVVEFSGPRNVSKMADIEECRAEFDVTVLLVARAYFLGIDEKMVDDE